MDQDNPVVEGCLRGTRAEFEGKTEEARDLYQQAWEAAQDDYEACIAAHYVARLQNTPEERLWWNQEALARGDGIRDERVKVFYPSLYVNLGHSYEEVGDQELANRYFQLAAGLGLIHQREADNPGGIRGS